MTTIIEAEHPYKYTDDDGSLISFNKGERFILIAKSSEDWWKVQRTGLYTGKSICYVPASYVREIVKNDNKYDQYVNLDVYQKIINKDYDGLSKINKPMVVAKQKSLDEQQHLRSSSDYDYDDVAPEDVDDENDDDAFEETYENIPKDFKRLSLNRSFDQDLVVPTSPLSFEISPRPDRMQSFTLPATWRKNSKDGSNGKANVNANEKDKQAPFKPPRTHTMSKSPPRSYTMSKSQSAGKLSLIENKSSLPDGWQIEMEADSGDTVYFNTISNERWKSCKDSHNRTYYYNMNGDETSWELPTPTHNKIPKPLRRKSFDESLEGVIRRRSNDNLLNRNSKCQSVVVVHSNLSCEDVRKSPNVSPRPITMIDTSTSHERSASNISSDSLDGSFDENKTVRTPDKEGFLSKRRTIENRKPIKKPWVLLYCCKFGSVLVFYKDQKSASLKSGFSIGKPESSLDLRGSKLEHVSKDKAQGKKNVFQLTSYGGITKTQFYADKDIEMASWITVIQTTIKQLEEDEPLPPPPITVDETDSAINEKSSSNQLSTSTSGRPISPMMPRHLQTGEKDKGFKGFSRRFSKKVQNTSNPNPSNDDENKTKIKNKLKKYLTKRPSVAELEEKGIMTDYVFGFSLVKLCEREETLVPSFIVNIICEVERRGLEVDGLYRVSGNLSAIQKLRLKIDNGEHINYSDSQWNDIHLLTGALKLYFRELPEPLIPFDMYNKFVSIIKNPFKPQRLKQYKEALKSMPAENVETFQLLITHLKRVMNKSSKNRMHSQNLAIVFGPTLLRPPENDFSLVAMSTIYQNQIVEYFLLNCEEIFPGF